MPYAEATDIEARLGRPLDLSEAQIVEVRLGDILLMIRARIPDLDARVNAGSVSEDAVRFVQAEALLRLIRNPSGYIGETDGNYSYEISAEVASGRLEILKSEWRMLGVRTAVFTVAPRVPIPGGNGSTCPPWATYFPPCPGANHDTFHPAVWWTDE